ncbi:MAG: glycosyltransferase, partial [Actinomycetota bacterium]|nr:glycosyltransferase [Actinomycetota bacterium]
MRRKRILRVITRLNVGGPTLHAAILSTRLDPDRFETLLVAGTESASEGSMLELGRLGAGINLRRVPALGREISALDDIRALATVRRIAREFRPDIVHTHLAKAGAIGRAAARMSGVPVVIHTYHGTVFSGYFGR